MAGTTGLEPATSAVTVLHSEVFQRLTNRGERLRPPKSCKTAHFVDWIVDQELSRQMVAGTVPDLWPHLPTVRLRIAELASKHGTYEV
jgi:hypothetical protein